jgi:hypothetical protein
LPDVVRIVLDPTRLRKVLLEFALRKSQDPSVAIEYNRARTGRTLIERQNYGDLG